MENYHLESSSFSFGNQEIYPLAIFADNRPKHLQACLDSLAANEMSSQTKVFLFIDGPKNNKDRILINACLQLAYNEKRFKSIEVFSQSSNIGLAKSIIQGVGRVLLNHEALIVVEDDLRVSPYFLDFMNLGLNKYKEFPKVSSLHAYLYPIKNFSDMAFFLRGADCWGWATWRDRWENANLDADDLYSKILEANLSEKFDLDGAVGYSSLLKSQIDGFVDSWAIRWHAFNFIEDKYCLHPPVSLVRNVGNDGTGRHYSRQKIYNLEQWDFRTIIFPNIIEESNEMRSRIIEFLIGTKNKDKSLLHKLFNRFG